MHCFYFFLFASTKGTDKICRAYVLVVDGSRCPINKGDDNKQKQTRSGGRSARNVLALPTVPPFVPSQEIAWGTPQRLQAALRYALMLAVI